MNDLLQIKHCKNNDRGIAFLLCILFLPVFLFVQRSKGCSSKQRVKPGCSELLILSEFLIVALPSQMDAGKREDKIEQGQTSNILKLLCSEYTVIERVL